MKTSKAQIQARLVDCERERSALDQALNAFLNGDECSPVYRSKNYTLRVLRPNWAHGGVLLLTFHPADNPVQRPGTSAHYWETWFASIRDSFVASIDSKGEAYEVRELALKAAAWVREMQKAEEAA